MVTPVPTTGAAGHCRTPEARARASSWILDERASSYHWREAGGWLSIKSVPVGQALYALDDARFLVDESAYLVLNAGQPYSVTIESVEPVEIFCVFFGPDFVAGVVQALTLSPAELLDGEAPAPCPERPFVERLHCHDTIVSPRLRSLRAMLRARRDTPAALVEALHGLADALLWLHGEVQREIRRMPQVRASTRAELYRRLHHARDFIDANMGAPITLSDTAGVARLSPHHCLRLFKQTFGETPHQYLTRRRIERAQRLLALGSLSVTDICMESGFESLGSFSWLFRQRVGVSPQEFRKRASRPGAQILNFQEARARARS